MPFYDFWCVNCQRSETFYHKIQDRDERHIHCDRTMQRRITAPYIRPEIEPFVSPASGKIINSRVQRKEDMLREGAIELEPGLREHVEKRRLELIEKDIQVCEANVDQTVSELHAAGLISGD